MDYQETLTKAYEHLDTKKNTPELFCSFVNTIQSVPSDITPETQKKFQNLFPAINKRIQEYDEQYQIIVNELGVLCTQSSETETETVDISKKFFRGLLDLFNLAYAVYEEDPETVEVFTPLLEEIEGLLSTGKMNVPTDPLEQALLVQLTNTAWAFTKAQEDMKVYAKQVGGKRNQTQKGKTRKNKRKV